MVVKLPILSVKEDHDLFKRTISVFKEVFLILDYFTLIIHGEKEEGKGPVI